MRISAPLRWSVVVLGGLLLAGGCVSKAEYDECLAANRRMSAELDKALEQLERYRQGQGGLGEQLASCQAALDAKQEQLAALQNRHASLQARFREMEELYRQSQMDQDVPPPMGVVLPARVDQALREFARENPQLVDYLPEFGMVKFKSDLTFAKGSDDVSSAAADALRKLTEVLTSPDAQGFYVYVAGHTDNIPIKKASTRRRHPNNWYLSVHRAVAVQDVLTDANMDPERIAAMGFGEYHPIAPNAPGQKGNPQNRRVEIWIVPEGQFLTQGKGQASGGTGGDATLMPSKG
jgi:chemotaxis protein MotB